MTRPGTQPAFAFCRPWVALLVAGLACGALADEPQPTVATAPETQPQTEPAHLAAKEKSASATIPGLSPETFSVPPGRYFPEGTFLVRRTGTIRTLKTGEVLFIPDMPSPRDVRRRGERPMVLLPNQTLSALQSSIATSPDLDKTRVELSGQLFVYRERQQLLPTIFTIIRSNPAAAQPGSGQPPTKIEKPPATDDSNESTAVKPGDDPEVADIIKQLESRRSDGPAPVSAGNASIPSAEDAAPASDPRSAERGSGSKTLVPEGTIFTDRRGRLVRIGDKLAIAFDGDANAAADPAMYILRSRALERLEAVAANRSGTLDVVVSGRVYAYRNQNYFLPLMAQIEPEGQLRPLQ